MFSYTGLVFYQHKGLIHPHHGSERYMERRALKNGGKDTQQTKKKKGEDKYVPVKLPLYVVGPWGSPLGICFDP